jgi:hypothetical protein
MHKRTGEAFESRDAALAPQQEVYSRVVRHNSPSPSDSGHVAGHRAVCYRGVADGDEVTISASWGVAAGESTTGLPR